MPFRDVTLPDGSTVRSRVSDQAIADWLATREVVRSQIGFDRPPDWDTGPTRGWLPHVNDPTDRSVYGRLTFGGKPITDADGAMPAGEPIVSEQDLVAWVWEGRSAVVTKLIVSQRGDGGFRVKHRAFTQRTVPDLGLKPGDFLVDTEWLIKAEHDVVAVGDWIEAKLIEVDAVANMAAARGRQITNETILIPRMELAHEREDSMDLTDEARADVIAEFGWAEWAEPFLGPKPVEVSNAG